LRIFPDHFGFVNTSMLQVSTAYAQSLHNVSLSVNISYASVNADNAPLLIPSLPLRIGNAYNIPVYFQLPSVHKNNMM